MQRLSTCEKQYFEPIYRMIFCETKLKGAFVIKPEKNVDERGFFARTYCKKEFEANGLNGTVVQSNISYNKKKGTFRGMHFQLPPFEEDKIVSCLQGAFLDFFVDMRENSPTFRQCMSVELNAADGYSIFIPKRFAHGFFTLVDDTVIHYHMSEFYQPGCASGFRFDDPAFNIQLPFAITTISPRDAQFSDLLVPAD